MENSNKSWKHNKVLVANHLEAIWSRAVGAFVGGEDESLLGFVMTE